MSYSSWEFFYDLIGENINSGKIKQFICDINERPKINKYNFDKGCYYTFRYFGIDLETNSNIIRRIFLRNLGDSGHFSRCSKLKPFSGDLPFNISFHDSISTVEEKSNLYCDNNQDISFYNGNKKVRVKIVFKYCHNKYDADAVKHILIELENWKIGILA